MKQLLWKIRLGLLVCGLVAPGFRAAGQTRINLKTQSSGVDFSQLQSTSPFATGTILPATCEEGQAFFKSDAAPGANIYLCTATNLWSAVKGGGAGTSGLKVNRSSDTVLAVGACSASEPCIYAFGETAVQLTTSPSVQVISGTGAVLGWLDRSGGYTVGAPSGVSLSCSTGCTVISGVSAFPADSIPQFTWSTANGKWADAGTDLQALTRRDVLIAGENISLIRNGDHTTISASIGQAALSTSGSSVDGEMVLFNGSTGKLLKRAEGNGLVQLTAGVVSTISNISGNLIDSASKQGGGSKLATADNITPGTCAQWDASGKLVSAATVCAPSGPQGPAGIAGPQGPTGPQGSAGPQGNQGITGPQGSTGLTGATESQGPPGPMGVSVLTTTGTSVWSVPTGVVRVFVQVWAGGGGGGYSEGWCNVTGFSAISVTVGAGGSPGIANDGSTPGGTGGSSAFHTCVSASGGIGGFSAGGAPGRDSRFPNGLMINGGGTGLVIGAGGAVGPTGANGPSALRTDQGGSGAGASTGASVPGGVGGYSLLGGSGGGSGARGNGVSTVNGGAGGASNGGGGGGTGGGATGATLTSCTTGELPAGGGGGGSSNGTAGNAGCSGGHGEVRIWW